MARTAYTGSRIREVTFPSCRTAGCRRSGYAGRLVGVRWEIMSSLGHAAYGKPVPAESKNPRYLRLVPDMQDQDIMIHGLTGDVAW